MTIHAHLPPSYFEELRPHLPYRARGVLLAFQSAAACADCRSVLEDWIEARPEPNSTIRLLRGIVGTTPPAGDLETAHGEATELAALSAAEVAPTLRRSKTRFRSPTLVVVLLARSRTTLTTSTKDACALAHVAAAAADNMARPDLEALALAHAANARRADGWLDEADARLARAVDRLTVAPEAPGPWIEAEIASLTGSLHKDHRHLGPAREQLTAAIAGFHHAGDREAAARARMKLAAVHRLAGSPAAALREIRVALDELDPFADRSLYLRALHNLALYLCDAGQPRHARDLLDLLTPLYERFPATGVRRCWLAGVVARELANMEVAEAHLRSALRSFVQDECPVYASLVALDLCELYLAEGRTAEVEAVTRDLPALFQKLDVRPEAAAAVLMFHKAAARNELSRHLVAHLREFLQRAQVDRSARFAPPAS